MKCSQLVMLVSGHGQTAPLHDLQSMGGIQGHAPQNDGLQNDHCLQHPHISPVMQAFCAMACCLYGTYGGKVGCMLWALYVHALQACILLQIQRSHARAQTRIAHMLRVWVCTLHICSRAVASCCQRAARVTTLQCKRWPQTRVEALARF